MAAVPQYKGPFGKEQAERLLWRAGFGAREEEAVALTKRGLKHAVHALTRPAPYALSGEPPHDERNRAIAPADAIGHDHLFWLDRMVRTNAPMIERMALVWHDWFATSNQGVGSQQLMLAQNEVFRGNALGSFKDLLMTITQDPAMLVWLNGNQNVRGKPNENYAREMMELFSLGAGRGYRERDVREQARALTGWRNDWHDNAGPTNFRYDPRWHDGGRKTIFGRRGTYRWQDSVKLCLRNKAHPSFFVRKLWSYFVPTPPDAATQQALEHVYTGSRHEVRPVLEAILRHPDLYEGPRMVKPPAVYNAGLLRMLGRGIDSDAWTWLGAMAGQQLFYPPNVAGWDDTRWLDTATFRGRFHIVTYVLQPAALDVNANAGKLPTDPKALLDNALGFWGNPQLNDGTRGALLQFARDAIGDAGRTTWKKQQYPVMVVNALRHLIAVSPDLVTC